MTWPSAERLCVAWAKDQPGIAALVDTRVSTRLPPPDQIVPRGGWPWLTVTRVGGGALLSHTPIDEAMVQWDAWGAPPATPAGGSNWSQAEDVARALLDALFNISTEYVTGEGVIYDASLVSTRRMWEPETQIARYIVDAVIGIRAAA